MFLIDLTQVFEKFLRGDTLAQCYDAVGEVANQWLDVLYSKGGDVDDDELMELISQNKTMSQTLEDYGTAKVRRGGGGEGGGVCLACDRVCRIFLGPFFFFFLEKGTLFGRLAFAYGRRRPRRLERRPDGF